MTTSFARAFFIKAAVRYAATDGYAASPAGPAVSFSTLGSGGGHVSPTYPPEAVQPEEGGSVAVTSARPKAGDEVDITPKPDARVDYCRNARG